MGRIKKCHRIICFGMLFVCTLAGIALCREYWERHRILDKGKIYVQANRIVCELEKAQGKINKASETLCKESAISVYIMDLQGEKLDAYGPFAKEISFRQAGGEVFTTKGNRTDLFFPLQYEDVQFASAFFTVQSADYIKWEGKSQAGFYLCIVLFAFTDAFLVGCYVWLLRDVHAPLEKLHWEITQILHGNIDSPLLYDYDDEVGRLCHDVELLRSELQFSKQQNQKMKESEKNLLACISHDMKTPLFAISSHAEAIKDGIVETKEEIEEYTEVIIRRARVMETLVNDILEHSETELQELSIVRTPCYAAEYFGQVFAEVAKDFFVYGNRVTVSEIPECSIMIDKFRIQQVIFNITSNALKYSDYQTDLDVQISLCNIDKKEGILVKISDNGKGISAADLPFVFERFFRGEKARSSDIPGSGLGLNTSKYIIEKHGGKIECDSIVSKGTTVTFFLPL